MLLGALPKTFQDGATKLLHNHLKNSSNTSVVRGPCPCKQQSTKDSSSLTSSCTCSVAWIICNCYLEAIWQQRLLFDVAFIGNIKIKNSVIFKFNIVITSTDLKKINYWEAHKSWWGLCFQVGGAFENLASNDILAKTEILIPQIFWAYHYYWNQFNNRYIVY